LPGAWEIRAVRWIGRIRRVRQVHRVRRAREVGGWRHLVDGRGDDRHLYPVVVRRGKGLAGTGAENLVEGGRVEAPFEEVALLEHPLEERDRGLDADHLVLAQRA